MKLLVGAIAVLGLFTVSARAADGRLPEQSLARLGLGAMQAMTDTQGLDIRGLGVAEFSGYSSNYEGQGYYGEEWYYKHHEKRHHEKHHEKCCEHERCCGHERECCHSCCHLESLCHLQSCGGRKG